ncbi:zinc carboxypeptidase [Nitzschia inconspicua]|uniref:Zinc carboxypeptidase n=1 Tax=Nitzschia inconspicua TaxID=303405 RepID=A0A9K3PVC9_9STRA|nr:zinc carboxypeptidase [Nitzschia inconspicua]
MGVLSSLIPLAFGCLLAPTANAMGSDSFGLWDAAKVVDTITQWKLKYPDLIDTATAQSLYGLPSSGNKQDCPYDGKHVGCLNHFFTIQDFISHKKGSESSASLPEVLWTGSLHGDETLGPAVVMEAAALLLEAASCEAKPRLHASNWDVEVSEALACRTDLRSRGVDDTHRQWLARLVSTRRIVVVPNANALGHFRKEHLEGTVDPAEDFPYNIKSPEACMRSLAARTLNEIFRTHIFQVAISFKEGEDHIEYSWGSQEYLSPDAIAYDRVAESLSNVVGGRNMYSFAPSNRKSVNPKMAFQDWAYAASWENPRTFPCTPDRDSYGGYDPSKSSYSVETNRALSFTVSSRVDTAGAGRKTDNVSNVSHAKDNVDQGISISRNIRLALVATELVEPYVSIFGVNNVAISDDIVPSSYYQSGDMCDVSRVVAVPGALSTVIIEWTVGGSLNISQTDLWVAKASDLQDESICSMNLNDGFEAVKSIFTKIDSLPRSGSGFFSTNGPDPSPKESVSKPFSLLEGRGAVSDAKSNAMGGIYNAPTDSHSLTSVNLLGPVFRAEIDLGDYQLGDQLILVATATVDQEWINVPSEYHQPLVHPQSHLANMRTNPQHEFEISGKRLQGRLDWISVPVVVIVDEIDKHAGGIELYKRLDKNDGYEKPKEETLYLFGSSSNNDFFLMIAIWLIIGAVAVVLICLFIFLVCGRSGRRATRRQRHPTAGDGVFNSQPCPDKSRRPSTKSRVSSKNGLFFDNIQEQGKSSKRHPDDDLVDDLRFDNVRVKDAVDRRIERDQCDQTMHGRGVVEIDLSDDDEKDDIIDFESNMIHSSSYPPVCSGGLV